MHLYLHLLGLHSYEVFAYVSSPSPHRRCQAVNYCYMRMFCTILLNKSYCPSRAATNAARACRGNWAKRGGVTKDRGWYRRTYSEVYISIPEV